MIEGKGEQMGDGLNDLVFVSIMNPSIGMVWWSIIVNRRLYFESMKSFYIVRWFIYLQLMCCKEFTLAIVHRGSKVNKGSQIAIKEKKKRLVMNWSY